VSEISTAAINREIGMGGARGESRGPYPMRVTVRRIRVTTRVLEEYLGRRITFARFGSFGPIHLSH
jgi:hypothetical protein